MGKEDSIKYIDKTAAVLQDPFKNVDPDKDPANYVLKTICIRLLGDSGMNDGNV